MAPGKAESRSLADFGTSWAVTNVGKTAVVDGGRWFRDELQAATKAASCRSPRSQAWGRGRYVGGACDKKTCDPGVFIFEQGRHTAGHQTVDAGRSRSCVVEQGERRCAAAPQRSNTIDLRQGLAAGSFRCEAAND